MNMELWGNDGQRDFKICEVDNRQYGALIGNALWQTYNAKSGSQPGFSLQRLWQRDMSNPREPKMLDHWPEEWPLRTLFQATKRPGTSEEEKHS